MNQTKQTDRPGGYRCPYCNQRSLETVATAPYVRGFLIMMLIGSKSFIGCVPCVRSRVLGEAGSASVPKRVYGPSMFALTAGIGQKCATMTPYCSAR